MHLKKIHNYVVGAMRCRDNRIVIICEEITGLIICFMELKLPTLALSEADNATISL